MTAKTVENATATLPEEFETVRDAGISATEFTAERITLQSQVFIFDRTGRFARLEEDGEFVLDIDTSGVVRGTHSMPEPHDVHGIVLPTVPPSIEIRSVDGIRVHSGARVNLGGERFIGIRMPLTLAALSQEEGVWVGTKVG